MESQDGRDRMENESEDFHYIKKYISRILDPRPGTLNPAFWIQDPGTRTLHP
jgi:hypothetical protein